MVLARYFKIHGARLDLRLAFRSCRSLPSSYLPFVLLMPTTCLKLCEGFTGLGQDWARNCSRLVTLDDEINLDWIELNAIADAAGLLGRDQGGTGPRKGSMTMSPRLVISRRASINIAVGLAVG